MIQREIQPQIEKKLFKGKILIIYGARQVGKTTVIKLIYEKQKESSLFLNCDEPDIRLMLTDVTSTTLKNIVGNKKLIFIDEAQRVKNIGLTLKLFSDELKNIQVVATGSSSFELSNEINEPLTGRKFEFLMLPLSMRELYINYGLIEVNRLLKERMIFGMYPEVVQNTGESKNVLKEITTSYLFKDILSYQGIRKTEPIEKILILLAAQTGNEVSYNEIANSVGIDKDTVSKYIDILEKAFIIFRLNPFSKNVRTEITKLRKIYFYDTGIRNMLLTNLNRFEIRNDKDQLWENFILVERMKRNLIKNIDVKTYFWRTTQQQEIDYIEESSGKISVFEFSFSENKKKKISKTFLNNYPAKETSIITSKNYNEFLGFNELVS